MVDAADELYAMWDGKPAQAHGGTANVVPRTPACTSAPSTCAVSRPSRKFFAKINEPLNITHEVLEYWTTEEGVCFLRGEATMARKAESATVVRAPFMHIYYLGTTEPVRIETLRITAGPLQTDAVM
jgi:hypothetical protein